MQPFPARSGPAGDVTARLPSSIVSTLAAVQSPASEELALAALEWVEGQGGGDGGARGGSATRSAPEPAPTLYHGTAGIVLALLEADAHFGDRRWGELAVRGTRWLAAAVDTW